ncbi:MAG: serine/threonine-protein kinase [Myxococcaceae bacterium]
MSLDTTMDCPDENRLVEYVDNRLAASDAAVLASHTESCASCRKLVVALTRLRSGERPPGFSATAPSASGELELQPGTLLGRYLVQKRVGEGAMGVVYQAHDPALDRKVALKLLRSGATGPAGEAQARLKREGQAVARLSHPNVITVHDVGEHDGQFFVAMELIDGQTLRQWLATRRATSVKLSILVAAGKGLAAAHAAQVVHRDFKPDNVLVARNRVVVTDFGLATEPQPSDANTLSNALGDSVTTRTGALLGTPAYMAPEQLEAKGADARSDQFSFCVTVYEALTGVRPFGGTDLKSLRASIGQGVPASGWARVPAQVRRVLERGLKDSPGDRYPSMEALLKELEPKRVGAFVPAAFASVALVVIGGGGLLQLSRACSGAKAHLSGTWDASKRQALAKAFEDSKLPFQKASFDALASALDGWADQWAQGWESACVATRERGEQSEELLDLRMACLDQREAEVRSLTEVLAHADESAIRNAPAMIARMPPVSSCADLAALRAPVAAAAPALREELGRLRQEQAQVSALDAAAQYKEALPRADELVKKAEGLGYRPFEAEARVLHAEVLDGADENAKAEEELSAAVVAAEAGGHLAIAAEAWTRLVRAYSHRLGKFPEAHRSAKHAEAVLERLGGNPTTRSILYRYEGDLADDENHYPEALELYGKALELQKREAPGSTLVAGTLSAMGDTRRAMGDLKESVELHTEALQLLKAKLGEAHPTVGIATKVLGNDYWSKGQLDDALTWYRKAEAIELAALGPDALELASVRTNIGSVLIRQQKLKEAEEILKSALATEEKKLGAENPSLFAELNNLSVVYQYEGKLDEAERTLRRSLAIVEKAHGHLHDDVATTHINLGDVLLSEKQFEASVAEYEQASEITEKLLGPDHPNLGECLGGEAFPLLQLKRWPKALQVTERALSIFANKPANPLIDAFVHVAHARALWEVDARRRSQAHAEAKTARAAMVTAGAQDTELGEVDAWLKHH